MIQMIFNCLMLFWPAFQEQNKTVWSENDSNWKLVLQCLSFWMYASQLNKTVLFFRNVYQILYILLCAKSDVIWTRGSFHVTFCSIQNLNAIKKKYFHCCVLNKQFLLSAYLSLCIFTHKQKVINDYFWIYISKYNKRMLEFNIKYKFCYIDKPLWYQCFITFAGECTDGIL